MRDSSDEVLSLMPLYLWPRSPVIPSSGLGLLPYGSAASLEHTRLFHVPMFPLILFLQECSFFSLCYAFLYSIKVELKCLLQKAIPAWHHLPC